MSILQVLEVDNNIFAISDHGELIIWNLKGIKSINGSFLFQNNISIVPSRCRFRIDRDCLLEMNHLGKLIVMNNQETIYFTTTTQIYRQIQSNNLEGIVSIRASSFLEKKELINCLLLLSQETLLIGTDRGNLYHYNFNQNLVVKKVNMNNNIQNTELSYATIQKKSSEIYCISPHFNQGLILLGLSSGKLLIFSIQTFELVNELQTKSKQALQSIRKIVISKSLDRIFCLHESYITEWNCKINSCVSYIEYNNPRDLLQMNENIFILGNHSTLSWLTNSNHQIQLSMRSAKTIRQLSQKMIAVGGSQGAIDIFLNGIRLMTLFTN